MESKYTHKEKKEALMSFINKNRCRNSKKKLICMETIKKQSVNCLYCESKNEENKLFCSKICDLIYFSNLYRVTEIQINHSSTVLENIFFLPFELLTEESVKLYRNIVDQKIDFDKMLIRKKITDSDDDEFFFTYTFTFIKDFEKIKTILIKINTHINKNKYEIVDEKKCLYCKKESGKLFSIENTYYIGPFCSDFCYYTLLKYIENCLSITKNKHFTSLPPINFFSTKEILSLKRENVENSIIETVYRDKKMIVYFTNLD